MKKKLSFFLILIMIAVLMVTVIACAKKTPGDDDIDDPKNPTKEQITVPQAMQSTYEGLLAGSDALNEAKYFAVESYYTLYTQRELNYSITYKANYAENPQDSEIYLAMFDNGEHRNRLSVYYDGRNLFILTDYEKKYIEDFSMTAMFDSFFTLIRYADLSSQVFSEDGAYIFDKNNSALNLGLILEASSVSKRSVANTTRDSLEYTNIKLDAISDTVNTYMENYLGEIGNKFDVITEKFLGFSLSRVIESRFSYIQVNKMNIQRDNGVADYVHLDMSGSFRDTSKYKIIGEIRYKVASKVAIDEKANYDKTKYTQVSIGKNNYVGKILIPSLSKEDFDISIVTDLDTKANENNKLSIDIVDAKNSHLMGAYYRDQILFADISGLEDQYVKDAIALSAFNLPKVYFDGINLTNLINAIYNSGVKMLTTILDRSFDIGDIENENLYAIIMENFGNDGNTIHYTITEELIQLIRNDETRMAVLVANQLGIPVEKLDSILGADFFSNSSIKISYNLDTGTIGLSYYYNKDLIFKMSADKKDYTGITFPSDTTLATNAYNRLVIPDNIKTEINVEFVVANAKDTSDLSKILGAFIGDPSGKNTPYNIVKNQTLVLRAQASEKFVSLGNDSLVSEYLMRFDLFSKVNSQETLLMSVYTNPQNAKEFLVNYKMPIGKEPYQNLSGIKYKVPKAVVSDGLNTILGENNPFEDTSLFGIINEILSGKSSRTQITNSDGYFNFVLDVETDPKTGEQNDPVKNLIGVSDLRARVKTRFLFEEVVLNDVIATQYATPNIKGGNFESAVGIDSLYSPNSIWKNSIDVTFAGVGTIPMVPNYIPQSIAIAGDKKNYTPTCELFGQVSDYMVTIYKEIGTYTVKRLLTDTIIIDPAFTDKLPSEIEVEFTNGKTGFLKCSIEGLTDDVVTHAGLNLDVFANDKNMSYTLRIGGNSILEVAFTVYVAVHNRTVIPLTEDGEELTDDQNVPVIGIITIDPYAYAMKKMDNSFYNPILEGITNQNMKVYFNNVYGIDEISLENLTFNEEGANFFFLSKLNLSWAFDQTKIKYSGGQLYAYANYGEGATAIKVAIKVNVVAKQVSYVKINDEDINRYTIDSLITSTYAIPTQTGVGTSVRVYFVDNTYRIVRLNRPENISDEEYYQYYLPTELAWYIPDRNYMQGVTLEYGASALFGPSMGNTTYADISIGTLGTDRVNLYVEVPERREFVDGMPQTANAVKQITDNGDGTFTLSKITSVQISPVMFGENGTIYNFYSINPYDENGKLPNEIFMKVYKKQSNKNETIMKKYTVNWLTTAGVGGEETNILYIDDNGFARLAHPTTDQNDFYIYGVIGDGISKLTVTIKTRVRNLASELRSIEYEGLEIDVAELTIDPYKNYTLPASFTATLESGERVYRSNIEWMVQKEGDSEWLPINEPTSGSYDDSLYGENGKYLFNREGGMYLIRYILEAKGSVLSQALYIYVTVEPRTIVPNAINIYETGSLVNGYTDINYYKAYSKTLYDRIDSLINDTQKRLRIGIGFEEARTDLILDRYNLYVDWVRATPTDSNYQNSLDYLAYILKNPQGEEVMQLQGTIYTGTVNEQSLSITFSLAGLVISNITLLKAEYSESVDAIVLPQKEADGRINMTSIQNNGKLRIYIPKLFGLTIPVNNVERYATPYQYINYIFEKIIMVYYNGTTDSEITPQLDFGSYNELTFNRNVLGITDGLFMPDQQSTTIITIKKLSAGSAEENIMVEIVADIDVRETSSKPITAELYNELGESCSEDGYLLPTFIDVPYKNSGMVRYYLENGWRTSDTIGGGYATNIALTTINVLSLAPMIHEFYYVLPMQGLKDGVQDEGYFYLTVNIPRKNINDVNYTATADDSLYNITDGYITINNSYLFYNNQTTYTLGDKTYNTGYDYTKLPDVIDAKIITDYFDLTSVNFFNVSWVPIENAITENDIVNGIPRDSKRAIATATILSYYNASGEHVTQTVTVYIEMDAMAFNGIEYSKNGVSLDIREDQNHIKNTIVIDPYNEKIGYNGIFKLPTIGLVINFENGESYTVTPAANSPAENPITDDIRKFELLDNDGNVIRSITEIPYGYRGYTLNDNYLPMNGLLYIKMTMFTGQEIILTINILSRVIDAANIPNTVIKAGEITNVELPRIYYIDPYNSITHQLPTTASIFFKNSDEFTTLPISRWEILDIDTLEFHSIPLYRNININSTPFYSQESSVDSKYKYAYYNSDSTGYTGGIYYMEAYISMGTSASGVNIGEQGFDIMVIVLNRALKVPFTTNYEYTDPIEGLLKDIGGILDETMFVDYDKYYAEILNLYEFDPQYYYSAISDGPKVPKIDWSRYVNDSFVSYEGFTNKNVDGYLYVENTNIRYMYDLYKAQVQNTYAELIKSMTWDSFFFVENGKLVPLNYYSTQTVINLKKLQLELEVSVKNQTFRQLIDKFNSAENTASLAKRMESTLLRSVMSNNTDLKTDEEGIAFLYDMLKAQYATSDMKAEDKAIYLNWLDLYNKFKGNYPGFVENIDAEKLTPYQMLKRDLYNKAYESVTFYGEEETYNEALYAAAAKKLDNYINNAIFLKMYDMANAKERKLMSDRLNGESNVTSRSNALKLLMVYDLKTVGSYGETASAKISAPKVTFDQFKDNIDTFYFNIYTTLALDEEVYAQFSLNKEAIFAELIETSLLDVIDAYRKGIISTTLIDYFAALKAKVVNTMVPIDANGNTISFYYAESYHTYDYTVDKYTYNDDAKKATAITAYRNYVRTQAIAHVGAYSNETSAQGVWNSLYGAYYIKSNTAMMTVMNNILAANFNNYVNSMNSFKVYLQDEASKKYDIAINYADKLINGLVVDSLFANPDAVGNNDIQVYQVFAAIYGQSIGALNGENDIYTLVYNSLASTEQTILRGKFTEYSTGIDPYMRTIWYFLYDAGANVTIRRAAQDFFFVKICEAVGKNFFDLLYQKSNSKTNETKESLDIYLNNVQLGYANPAYELKLKKARVFRNLQTYYASVTGEAAVYKTLIQNIYDAVLIDIKDTAYNNLYSGLFIAYSASKEDFKAGKGNVNAKAFENLLSSYEADADTIIALYNKQVETYVNNNLYRYAEQLYLEAQEKNAFLFATSASDPTSKNYLELSQNEERYVERLAVNYYYNNLATSHQKLNIEGASGIFGEYIVGGKYSAPEGVYAHLINRYDLGDQFINNLTACKYYTILTYAEENVRNTVSAVYQNPNDAYYTEYYYNVYRDKLTVMGNYSLTATVEFARKGYINYQIEQNVLKTYLNDKLTINNDNLTPQGKETLYYNIYTNSLSSIINNQGVTLEGANALYYRLNMTLPPSLTLTPFELTNILNNHVILNGKKTDYVAIFAKAKEKLDSLESASYQNQAENAKTRNYQAYGIIKAKLLEKALEFIKEAVNEVEIREGYISVFDNLILSYYGTELELPDFTNAQILNVRDIRSVDANLVIAYDTYYAQCSAIQKGLLDAIYVQEGLRGNDLNNIDYLKTISYMVLGNLINTSINTLAFDIDYDLIELSDIQNNTRKIFNDDAKKEYLDLIIGYLKTNNFPIVAAYIEKEISKARYTTDFVVIDSFEGMTQEEHNAYLAELDKYVSYSTKVYNKLLLTSMNSTAKAYQSFVSLGKFLPVLESALNTRLSNSLQTYIEGVLDTTDASYLIVLNKMVNDSMVEYKFYTSDHILSSDEQKDMKNKHLLEFDVQLLQDENNSSTQDINKVKLSNLAKKSNPVTVFVRDGFRFVYPQIEIAYVDYYGMTDVSDAQDKYDGIATSDNKFLNKITIDPLNPDLPSKVRAYGIYRKMAGSGEYGILDVGIVDVTYDDIFLSLEGEYAGNAAQGDSSSSYQITAVNKKNDRFLISLTVFYLNRTVQSYYVSGAGYTSSANIISDGKYAKYYNLYDSNAQKNKMIIDPTLEETVDKDNITYKMPQVVTANYTNYESDTYRSASPKIMDYYNVVWDLSGIKYSLSGLAETPLRILSYFTNVGDGTYNKVVFDYVNNRMTINKYKESDNTRISVNTFIGIPSYAIWNVTLTVTAKTVDKIYLKNEDGTNTLLAQFISDDISGIGNNERWLVAEADFTVNPYYVEFFQDIVLEFSDGDSYEITTNIDWIYHSTNGIDKLKEIVNKSISEPNNRYIVAGFNYICENIWIKLMVDDIEILRPTVVDGQGNMVEGYINGGTIYLLAKTDTYTMEKEAQLAAFYPYLYYNFSQNKFYEDWRKVPLNFVANAIRDIKLNENNVYTDILATLGNNSSGFNISFTVKVINPKLYATLTGSNNSFVIYDSLSMPVDGNSRVISSSSDMPQIFGNYFVQLDATGSAMFNILTTAYDVVNEKVSYECRYYMNSSEEIAGGENGLMTLSFKTVMPLKTYNYTGINDIKFVTTPGANYSWRTVNSFEETDALYWTLGKTMKPSLLPRGYDTATGERIDFMWDLDNVNINLASGSQGYYTVRAYYYASGAQWLYKEVNIYILQQNISATIVPNTNLSKVYDGNKYTYNLDYNYLNKLRSDGTFAFIDSNNVTVEYRISTSSEYNYSTSYRPLNAGTYYIRITVDDYNYYGVTIITFIIEPFKIKGNVPGGIGGQTGLVTDIVFAGADASNYIYYTYNGQTQGLAVASGLPLVHVQNWPQTRDQKDSLYLSKLGLNPTAAEIIIAKSAAFNELYGRVTPATQVFLARFKAKVKVDYSIISENELNAKAFDLIDYNLYICEVVPTIVYKNMGDIILEKEPVDVGTYLFSYNIEASQNNGNYIFDPRTTIMAGRIVIQKQNITYSLVSNDLVYNAAFQHPLINNLHLPNGSLPIGVTVTYTYRYIKNLEWITTNQIKNVGVYALNITINGGNNYPSGTLENLTVNILAQDLMIGFDETATRSQYLSDIVDYSKHLKFEGLVGNDKPSDFYAPKVSGNVKSYYTLGQYPILVDGFKLDIADLYTYTKFETTEPIEIDGIRYFRLLLKNATETGSAYLHLDESGNYIYESLINKFNNYNIYIIADNVYTVYPDGEAIIVNNDLELTNALSAVPENGRATIYLAEGNYAKLNININASITLIGCYDENANIISVVDGITINEGEVTLRIIKMGGREGKDTVYIGDKAGMVSILDCLFDGASLASSRAIVTSEGYEGLLYIHKTTITRHTRAIELRNGSSEITQCVFRANTFGISAYTELEVYIRDCDFISTSNEALILEHSNYILLECLFDANLVAVKANSEGETTILQQNTFTSTNGKKFQSLY